MYACRMTTAGEPWLLDVEDDTGRSHHAGADLGGPIS